MITASQAAIAAYVHAMMQALTPASPPGRKLAEWLHYHQCVVGLDFQAAVARATPEGAAAPEQPDLEKPLPAALWEKLRADIGRTADAAELEQDSVAASIDTFASAVGLDPTDAALFRFVFYTDCDKSFDRLCGRIVGTRAFDTLGLTSLCLGLSAGDIHGRLTHGPLRRLHLVGSTGDIGDRFGYFVPHRLVRALTRGRNIADIEAWLIGTPMPSRLAACDYDHVAGERDFTMRLLRGAIDARRKGVNILIYGAPGTGKSEFCKMVAREIGCDLFGVGEADEDGEEPSRWDRLDALRLADRLAGDRGKALLLFDEMEDILADGDRTTSNWGSIRRAGSKVFFNRLLEQNQVPVLWTANAVDEFDPAFLRRMTFAFEMKPLPARARARLWESFAERQGVALPAQQAETLARRHKVSPGIMTGAVQAVAMAGGKPEEIDFVVQSLAKPFQRCTPPQAPASAAPFDPMLANTDVDLAWLQAALVVPGAPRDVSLCFYGPPGTGTSEFARQLAAAMGLEPLLKRGSDLLSKWIGETEKNLARAFEEARQDNAFLIIDEAEGLLWNRAGASKSWEVTMVNELLVQMETHPLPFACTTNHLESIDSAALRRFAFKVKFDFMTQAQSAEACRRFFGCEPPAGLRSVEHLTPGDFAVVAKKLRLLAQVDGARPDLVRLLQQEVAAKNLRPMKIGF